MPEITAWSELGTAADSAGILGSEVRDLGRQVLDRLGELSSNPWDAADPAREGAWCKDTTAVLWAARLLLRSLLADMSQDWRA